MAQGEQEKKPEEKKNDDELSPEDLDDIAGGQRPVFIREAGPIFVQ
jgi:hypothetical protein